MTTDRAAIAAMLRHLTPEPGGIFELRGLAVGKRRAVSAYFRLPDEAEAMAALAVELESRGAKGVYWTLNPVIEDKGGAAASDPDVAFRQWLLIDVDPVRPADTSATEDEKQAARALAREVVGGLDQIGLRGVEVGDSGNGYHLLYPIVLPNDEQARALVEGFLKGLAARLDNDRARIDTGNFNASRIFRLWGTAARKGADTAERPHRRGRWYQDRASAVRTEEVAAANSDALARILGDWAAQDQTRTAKPAEGGTVGDDFDRRASWESILEPLGWHRVGATGDKVYWARPGKTEGHSATTGFAVGEDGADLLHVFSSNAEPLEAGKSYGKFRAYALLHHKGDYKAAAKNLARQGYGGASPAKVDPALVNVVPTTGEESPVPAPILASDLLLMEFTEPPCIVAGLVPIGLTLLAGRPKQGKSWLALQLSLATVLGRNALGKPVVAGDVLYLALEDHQRRMHGRLRHLLGAAPYPEDLRRLSLLFGDVKPGDLRAVEEWTKRAAAPKLVVIDTLGRFLPPNKRRDAGGDTFQVDYAWMAELKALADAANVGMILIHHTRKSAADDPLTEVSGSTALTAAADAVLVLRRNRAEQDASLTVTGRDFDDAELNIQWNNGLWSLGGNGHVAGQKAHGPAPEKLLTASAWLREFLADGPRRVTQVRSAAEDADPPISAKTLYRAKDSLGVEEYVSGGKWWRLPPPESADQ